MEFFDGSINAGQGIVPVHSSHPEQQLKTGKSAFEQAGGKHVDWAQNQQQTGVDVLGYDEPEDSGTKRKPISKDLQRPIEQKINLNNSWKYLAGTKTLPVDANGYFDKDGFFHRHRKGVDGAYKHEPTAESDLKFYHPIPQGPDPDEYDSDFAYRPNRQAPRTGVPDDHDEFLDGPRHYTLDGRNPIRKQDETKHFSADDLRWMNYDPAKNSGAKRALSSDVETDSRVETDSHVEAETYKAKFTSQKKKAVYQARTARIGQYIQTFGLLAIKDLIVSKFTSKATVWNKDHDKALLTMKTDLDSWVSKAMKIFAKLTPIITAAVGIALIVTGVGAPVGAALLIASAVMLTTQNVGNVVQEMSELSLNYNAAKMKPLNDLKNLYSAKDIMQQRLHNAQTALNEDKNNPELQVQVSNFTQRVEEMDKLIGKAQDALKEATSKGAKAKFAAKAAYILGKAALLQVLTFTMMGGAANMLPSVAQKAMGAGFGATFASHFTSVFGHNTAAWALGISVAYRSIGDQLVDRFCNVRWRLPEIEGNVLYNSFSKNYDWMDYAQFTTKEWAKRNI